MCLQKIKFYFFESHRAYYRIEFVLSIACADIHFSMRNLNTKIAFDNNSFQKNF